MIKVVHVTTVSQSLRYLLLNQLLSIKEAGYDVCSISSPGNDVSILELAGISHTAVTMSRRMAPGADLVSLWKLYRIMSRERFTIVHTHNPKPGFLGQIAARMAGVPIIVNTLHGFYFHDHMPLHWRRFYIALEKIAARCSDAILSQNSEDIETAVDEGICRKDKIEYLGNGIDLNRFDPAKISLKKIAETRAELGIPEGAPVVGFVGRLVREKGVLELLSAGQIIRSQFPTVRFLFVGRLDSEKKDALTPAIAAEFDLAANCIFAGQRQDMPELYKLMNVFVLPSHREGFPRSPMEASAMAVPCVLTNIRGCREAVVDGENGLLVGLKEPDELARSVIQLLKSRELAGRLSRQGRKIAEERFDERFVFERVQRTYARLLQEKGLAVQNSYS